MTRMNKVCVLFFLFLASVLLVSCSSNSAPPPQPSTAAPSSAAPATTAAPAGGENPVRAKLAELSGSGATDCGDVKTMNEGEIKKASDCALDASKAKKAFLVSYTMPGMTVGVAGNAEGKSFTVQSEEENGKPAAPKSQPCPAEVRVAQSGRVTCMPAGSMGVAPGSGNPHAAPGASPHGGGMATPPAGTPNPHKSPEKSH